MNERVKELALQAWQQTSLHVSTEKRDMPNIVISQDDVTDIFEQEFAKLIVKECADLIDTLNESYGAPSTGGKFIKNHFGVEDEGV